MFPLITPVQDASRNIDQLCTDLELYGPHTSKPILHSLERKEQHSCSLIFLETWRDCSISYPDSQHEPQSVEKSSSVQQQLGCNFSHSPQVFKAIKCCRSFDLRTRKNNLNVFISKQKSACHLQTVQMNLLDMAKRLCWLLLCLEFQCQSNSV